MDDLIPNPVDGGMFLNRGAIMLIAESDGPITGPQVVIPSVRPRGANLA